MENRDHLRDQGSPDRPPDKPTPGHDDTGPTDPGRIREDEGDIERQSPRRDPRPDEAPGSA